MINKGLIYFQKVSGYEDDKVAPNHKLRPEDFDSNFYALKSNDISDVHFIKEDNTIYIYRYDCEDVLKIKLPFEDYFTKEEAVVWQEQLDTWMIESVKDLENKVDAAISGMSAYTQELVVESHKECKKDIEDLRIYTTSAIDELNDKIDELNECVSDKIKEMRSEIASFEESANTKIEILISDFEKLKKDINDSLEEAIKEMAEIVNTSVEELKAKISDIKSEINDIDVEIDNLKTVDAENIHKIAQLDKKLDDEVNAINLSIDTIKTDLNNKIDDSVNGLIDEIAEIKIGHEEDIQEVKLSIHGLENELDEANKNISTNTLNIYELNTHVDEEVERLDNRIDGLSGYSAEEIDEKCGELNGRLDKLTNSVTSDIKNINEKVSTNTNDISSINSTLSKATYNINQLNKKIDVTKEELKNDINDVVDSTSEVIEEKTNALANAILELEKQDTEQISSLKSRVSVNESDINTLKKDTANNAYNIATLKTESEKTDSELKESIEKLSSDTQSSIQKTNTNLKDEIVKLSATLKAKDKQLQDNINTNTQKIENLSDTIDKNTEDIKTNADKIQENNKALDEKITNLTVATESAIEELWDEKKTFSTITVDSSDDNLGIVYGGGIFPVNSETTLVAQEINDSIFIGWNDNDYYCVGEESNYDLTNPKKITIKGKAHYTAEFRQRLTITIKNSMPEAGYISYKPQLTDTPYVLRNKEINYYVAEGILQEITAIPKTGYKFVKWSDGNTNIKRFERLKQDATFEVIFEKEEE